MFRRVVIPATKGVPSRGFRWMPDKEYRAKDWFYIVCRVPRETGCIICPPENMNILTKQDD